LAALPTPHLEALLQRDIDVIRTKLLEMAALDEQALARAFQAFLGRDRQLAYSVILRDQDVDALETELDRLCVEFMVRHQPVAGHLRFIYSATKIISELERIGDYAESVARQVLLISSIPFEVRADKFHEIVNLAVPMLHNAVRSFLERNPDLARATMANEPRVNQVRDKINADLLEWRQQGTLPLEALTPMMTIARRFERVSDQATNICEQALYFATGEYLRHIPREGFHVLFLDGTNGCLSRIAEAIGSRLGAKRFSFGSAGVMAGALDPQTVRFLAEKGIDISPQASRSLDQVPQLDQMEVMVALCDEAERTFPQKPVKTLGLRWSVPDPLKARGTPAEVQAEYERAYQTLTGHIRDLVQAIIGNDQISTNEEATPPL
jgi:phosphate transport system protein